MNEALTPGSANLLLKKLTLDEKIQLLTGKNFWQLNGVERLGISEIMVADGPHGLRKQDLDNSDHLGIAQSVPAVCFPTAAGLASTWNTALINEIGKALGDMCLQEQVSVLLGPGVNIKRSPLCGRNFEYFSEDPYLSAQMAIAFIQGVQSKGVGTSIKHYAANNQEHNRLTIDAVVDERALREIYLPSFEYAVRQAQPWTVMASYNKLNGEYVVDSRRMLTDLLKTEWTHTGLVVTDWGAANNRVVSLAAGLELDMPGNYGFFAPAIKDALGNGSLAMADLDKNVLRILELILKSRENLKVGYKADLDAQHKLAVRVAEQACVLLKNDAAALPLQAGEKLLLVGEFAQTPRYQGAGSSQINPSQIDAPLEQLQCRLPAENQAEFALGYVAEQQQLDSGLLDEAVSKANMADKVVVFLGLPDSFESEGFDRSHMHLPENQLQLIEALIATGKSIVVVLQNGAPVELPFKNKVDAILEAYLSGQGGGTAIARLLLGDANPSGKLAETFAESLDDVLSQKWFPGTDRQVQYRESIWVGYRYFDQAALEVAYPFGHGLSYTRFDYSNLQVSVDSLDTKTLAEHSGLTISCAVTNSGSMAGFEIVQLYVTDSASTVFRPQQELKGFAKVWLQPGETKTASLELGRRSFAYWCTTANDWVVETGDFELRLAASSRDIRMSVQISVSSADTVAALPETLACYFEPKQREFSAEEFAELLGFDIPAEVRAKPYHLNSTMSDIQDTFLGQRIYAKAMTQWEESEGDDVATKKMKRMIRSIISESPLRASALMSGGKMSMKKLTALIHVLNKQYLKALWTLTSG